MISKIILTSFAIILFHGVVYCAPPYSTEENSKVATVKTVELPPEKGELPPSGNGTVTSTESSTVTVSTSPSNTTSETNATTKATVTPPSTKTSEATKRTTETTITKTTPVTTPVTTPMPVKTTTAESHSTESMHTADRQFDGPSFIGGIVLTIGLTAIGFIAFKFYKSGKTEENYGRL